jgi:hypothetical protein
MPLLTPIYVCVGVRLNRPSHRILREQASALACVAQDGGKQR